MSNSVQTKVAEQLATLSPKVEDSVVGVIVDRELQKRSNAFVGVLDKYTNLESDLRKIDKPDQSHFDAEGNKVSEFYSKKRLDEVGAVKKKLAKHAGAMTKALEKGDFSDVYNISSGKSDLQNTDGATDEAA